MMWAVSMAATGLQRGLAIDGVVGLQTWSIIDSLENEGPVS